MSFVSTLRQWDEAVACVEQRDPDSALRIFLNIEEKNSKIAFNIGCLYLNNDELDEAEKAFDGSIGKDQHLAVAFFQRGVAFYKKERFEESLLDFQQAFKQLRGNQLIDYKPLGLRYKLYACEVLHNIGLVQAQLEKWEKAQENLLTALSLRADAKFSHIDHALDAILKQKLFPLVEIRVGLIFKPNKHYVAELEKKDYLGKAKVVSSIVPADQFSGFAPLQPQVDNVPSTPKVPEVLRVFEGVPHTVLYEFVPETKEELAVLPGNIVFVLQKGADNWAFVVFNEKIEPVNENDDIPAPPRRAAPSRPVGTDGLKTVIGETSNASEFSGCVVKVHFQFTIAISIAPGQPYGVILQMISSKLKLPASTLILRYAKEGSDKRVIIEDSEMEAVWNSVKDGRLTLWCSVTEGKSVPHEKVVALYSYDSTTPEDLGFKQGNIITILSKVNDEWLEGQCNGKIGIFPSTFVKALNGDQKCK
ncbi:neutrophil cytosol factor 2 isoform X2 [Rhinichthys klamathensis goyatoka]|uniref:neutrophil cytosol factor 2 isoform X2 n=1 Tax=Rhinichthys klamathensis goyatoka TaxID=3034132 RepID=UPI0024B50042|nr:neutrophil cytosol factor 2 isoform X2 [Rhinichthys klamathensis goyatoka]